MAARYRRTSSPDLPAQPAGPTSRPYLPRARYLGNGRSMSAAPSLRLERRWLSNGYVLVAGSDEVGRGALSGPVTAGVIVIDAATKRPPTGLRDSKLLSAAAREKLVPRITRWAADSAVGHASSAEIDELGILCALRLAGERALSALGNPPEIVLLDGNYDWFTRPMRAAHSPLPAPISNVVMQIKADLLCATSAAASVVAKVERDAIMRDLASTHPEYGWEINKGYATPHHIDALREYGPCEHHRISWRLPGVQDDQLEMPFT
jgi:ribonuclease HII